MRQRFLDKYFKILKTSYLLSMFNTDYASLHRWRQWTHKMSVEKIRVANAIRCLEELSIDIGSDIQALKEYQQTL